MTAGDSGLRRIGIRADGYVDYYDETTDTVFREPESQYDLGLAGAIPTEWTRNQDLTVKRYIELTESETGWTQLSQWATDELESA